eukprot:TRINITY_DN9310_c0_g1_i1.p1 TRINITY_DN9310_c0_g1~~TRINITY_DN9310_c0_g1_i1.p1  ORF type:complete len:261 (-),score=55.94 TRINITY_DN9310_c0_g1_i1:369-1151(-)
MAVAVGVLALQGSFNEHLSALAKIGVKGVLVKKPEHLQGIDGLIIPGGESTTMARLAELHNLTHPLRDFCKQGKPVWGTCAGLIFLANKAIGQKAGGQELIGGLDCTVHRNFFGSQLNSFETELHVPKLAAVEGGPETFRAVFIRAPAILEAGPSVDVLAEYTIVSDGRIEMPSSTDSESKTGQTVIVAVRQGNLMATAFHPELTSDTRWHKYFLRMLKENGQQSLVCHEDEQALEISKLFPPVRDLPVFQQTETLSFES